MANMSFLNRCARNILKNMLICRRENIWTSRDWKIDGANEFEIKFAV